MPTIRCLRCGEELAVDSLFGGQSLSCPRCSQELPENYVTTMIRKGPAPLPASANDGSKDTDISVVVQTMSVSAPGAQSPKPGTIFGPEYYDFLAAPEQPEELGRLGTYRVLRILGVGGMGVVYEAEDPALQRRVALKAMLPTLAVSPSARQRFTREARAAAAVEHERIVPIFQVGEDRGIPFLVMPLLKGETLDNRLSRIGKLGIGETIRLGREIAEALAAAHERGLIHRDIKPANVWLEGLRGNVRLLDFGLARAAESTEAPLSQQGSIYGTPAFMAPEQAHGESVDPRTDLFSLGCVLYRMCSGELPFQGPSAITILLAVVGKHPPPPAELAPEIPSALSQLVMRLLAKTPAERPASAQAVIEALNGIPIQPEAYGSAASSLAEPPVKFGSNDLSIPPDAGPMLSATARAPQLPSRGVPQDAGPMLSATARAPQLSGPAVPPDAGAMLSATARTPQLSGSAFPPDSGLLVDGTARVPQVPPASSPPGGSASPVRDTAKMPEHLLPTRQTPGRLGRRTILFGGIGFVAVLGLAGLLGPYLFGLIYGPAPAVEIGVAYGSEKEHWFKEAVAEFAGTPEGKGIKVQLIPLGSVEGARAIADKEDQRINVWAPSSGIYKARLVSDWQAKHAGHNPILKEESLGMTPMVFVFWKERHDAFIAKYKEVSFQTVTEAMQAKRGWGDIAGKPEWGRFRFAMTNPHKSNSGLMALLMIACETNHDHAVTLADLKDVEFRSRLAALKQGLGGNAAPSTTTMMKDMVTKGPNGFDAVLIYENLAIEYLKAAQGRWDDLHVAYPRRNLWNENPYYILDVPWSSPEQRRAAETFLAFLLSVPMQQKALGRGFRPANINVPIREHPDSPFVRHQKNGLTVNITSRCDVGDAAILDELLNSWGK